MSKRFLWMIALAALPASAAWAAGIAALDDKSLPGRDRYDRCLELVQRNAESAYETANVWYAGGGGAAALHCQALALVSLRRYGEAAQKLDDAAHNATAGNASVRAALLDQAGNAWMLAGQSAKAVASLTAALVNSPNDADLLADRARAKALARDWPGAAADLSSVIAADPNRADALVLRASALHAEGHKADARADIERALSIYPGYPEALVERGSLKLENGDTAGARADWQQVLSEAPNSDAGAAARARLGSLAPGR
jgi:tetratricopeptide (TPR) repeat protein